MAGGLLLSLGGPPHMGSTQENRLAIRYELELQRIRTTFVFLSSSSLALIFPLLALGIVACLLGCQEHLGVVSFNFSLRSLFIFFFPTHGRRGGA